MKQNLNNKQPFKTLQELVDKRLSIKNCKECEFLYIKNDKIHCKNLNPTEETCNLLDQTNK